MADFAAVAKQFTDFYFQTFDTNRANLSGLYREQSMLTFEGEQFLGTAKIVEKLSELPFQKVAHKVDTMDAQPTSETAIVVLVTGKLMVDDSEHPIQFSQAFQLLSDAPGSYYVHNDVFRLVYG